MYSTLSKEEQKSGIKKAELIKAVQQDDELNVKSNEAGKPHTKEVIGKAIDRLIEKQQITVIAKARYMPLPV